MLAYDWSPRDCLTIKNQGVLDCPQDAAWSGRVNTELCPASWKEIQPGLSGRDCYSEGLKDQPQKVSGDHPYTQH